MAGVASAGRRLSARPHQAAALSDHWALAEAAAARAGVTLVPLRTAGEADDIARVMRSTWGGHEPLPREMIVALAEAGNVPYGARVGGDLVGYVLGWAGVTEADGLHVHSHQLATVPELRHQGIGYALKLAQRAQALDVGISVVRWTFDPLVSRNAWFNLVKLGAAADRFLPHFYGEMTDSINAGERSDRLLVRWDLNHMASGPSDAKGVAVLDRMGDEQMPRPSAVGEPPAAGAASIRIPRDYHELRSRDPELGALWRARTAEAFSACFDSGFIVGGYTRDWTYVLTKAPL